VVFPSSGRLKLRTLMERLATARQNVCDYVSVYSMASWASCDARTEYGQEGRRTNIVTAAGQQAARAQQTVWKNSLEVLECPGKILKCLWGTEWKWMYTCIYDSLCKYVGLYCMHFCAFSGVLLYWHCDVWYNMVIGSW